VPRVKLIIVPPLDTRQTGKIVELRPEEVYAVCASAPDHGRFPTHTATGSIGKVG
jgi:hypothetical protein